MARVLLLIILFGMLYLLSRRFISFLNKNPSQESPPIPEKMVKCLLCDAYIPESESKLLDGKTMCKHQPCKQ